MDPSDIVQDVLRCYLCDTLIPPLCCDLCHIYLCKACVGEHVLDISTEHKVVPIQQALTDPVYPRCPKHSSKQCELYCKHCTIPICVECATSKEHQEHRFVDLLKCAESKKEDIREDMNELESSILKEYKEIATGIPSQKAYLQDTADSLKTSIDEHGEQLYRQVDAIVKKLKSDVDKQEEKELSVLNKEEEEIARKISSIEKCIFDQKELQASRDLGHVFEYKSRNREFRNVLPKHKVKMPIFSASDITTNQLLAQFGSLTMLSERESRNQGQNPKTREVQFTTKDRHLTDKTKIQMSEPTVPETLGREDVFFETFFHKNGKEFQCMFVDGKRFYLDVRGSKEWQAFPKQWYNEGLLITDSVVKDEENAIRRRQKSSKPGSGGSRKSFPGINKSNWN